MMTIGIFFDQIMHIDKTLAYFVAQYGLLTYGLLFCLIFAETGLVVTPFLPGDSLLFAVGSLAANSALMLVPLLLLLIAAAILGNTTNYLIGRYIGLQLSHAKRPYCNPAYLQKTHQFYEKHGKKAIFLSRFLPIIRTFMPFVAGIGAMNYRLFSLYNALSAILWVGLLVLAGYWLGTLTFVKAHFSTIIYGMIALSLCPVLLTEMSWIYARSKN